MRVFFAILIGLVILFVGLGVLRGFAMPRRGVGTPGSPAQLEVPKPLPEGVRILYWCENCGMEVLLLRVGSEAPPRHCGEPMNRREEILRG
jgi:hypothetical protein